MKRSTVRAYFFVLLAFAFFVQTAAASNNRRAGIGVRGAHWRMGEPENIVHVTTMPAHAKVDVGNGGGYLYFFSRVSDATWMEFSIGAIGKVESKNEYFWGEEVDVDAVTPVLLGFRHDLFSYDTKSSLIPYVAFGAGPYWFNDVYVRSDQFGIDNEVLVKTKAKFGGYAGGGVNFGLTSWFGINFDARHHFMEFDVKNAKSGWEYGLGCYFSWGKYKKYVNRSYRRRSRRDREEVNIYID
jgi:hypothetical protein